MWKEVVDGVNYWWILTVNGRLISYLCFRSGCEHIISRMQQGSIICFCSPWLSYAYNINIKALCGVLSRQFLFRRYWLQHLHTIWSVGSMAGPVPELMNEAIRNAWLILVSVISGTKSVATPQELACRKKCVKLRPPTCWPRWLAPYFFFGQ